MLPHLHRAAPDRPSQFEHCSSIACDPCAMQVPSPRMGVTRRGAVQHGPWLARGAADDGTGRWPEPADLDG